MSMSSSPTTLSIAPYRAGGIKLDFELAPLFTAEHRLFEIAIADKSKAKELFTEYTKAYIYASKLHAMCQLHVAKAAIESRKRRAILVIDYMPEMAKAKGLSTSRSPTGAEDIREAFLYRDEEFLRIEEGRASLEAAEQLLFGKMMAFREAADAMKRLLSPDERPRMSNAETLPNAFGSDDVPDPIGASDQPVDGFDAPIYK